MLHKLWAATKQFVHIYSDTQAASLALCTTVITSHTVWECHILLGQLAVVNMSLSTVYLVIQVFVVMNWQGRELLSILLVQKQPDIRISSNLIRITFLKIFRQKQYVDS